VIAGGVSAPCGTGLCGEPGCSGVVVAEDENGLTTVDHGEVNADMAVVDDC